MSFSNEKQLTVSMYLAASLALLAGCASDVKRVSFPAGANANEEITKMDQEMAAAQVQQLDVTAPNGWRHADTALSNAKKLREKGKPQQDVLKSVGESRAALNEANERSSNAKTQLFDVLAARNQARTAGADKYFGKELQAIDAEAKDVTAEYEGGKGDISQKKRESLQTQYSDLELKSIKATYLSSAQNMVETAEKNQAQKYAPRSLEMAQAKLKNAETVISANRNDKAAIEAVSKDATTEAEKLTRINRDARSAKGQSPEEFALQMDSQKSELAAAGSTINNMQSQNSQLNQANQKLAGKASGVASQNAVLRDEAAFNESFKQAQAQFSKDQADVYRQGDKLLIRLKSVNFPSGRAEISGKTFPVLNQVKEVVASMKADQVLVEGHTDSGRRLWLRKTACDQQNSRWQSPEPPGRYRDHTSQNC
jgi:OOP family OmpA-OmpF porin